MSFGQRHPPPRRYLSTSRHPLQIPTRQVEADNINMSCRERHRDDFASDLIVKKTDAFSTGPVPMFRRRNAECPRLDTFHGQSAPVD